MIWIACIARSPFVQPNRVPRRGSNRPETKYTAGSVLVVGGSPGMTGAVCLAAEAAFRADAGYVAVAAPEESLTTPCIALVNWAMPLETVRQNSASVSSILFRLKGDLRKQ